MERHSSMQVFRHFSALNIRSILYYQAELLWLQGDLEGLEAADAASDQLPTKLNRVNWRALTMAPSQEPLAGSSQSSLPNSIPIPTPREHSQQWELFQRIRTVLEAYYSALQRQKEIESDYLQPRSNDLDNIRKWLEDGRFGAGFLLGNPENAWDPELEQPSSKGDFITTVNTGDRVSYAMGVWFLAGRHAARTAHRWLSQRFSTLLGRTTSVPTAPVTPNPANATPPTPSSTTDEEKQASSEADIQSLAHGSNRRVAAGILTVVASVLLVLPILILYLVQNLAVKVGLVFVFTVLMAAVMTFGLTLNAEKVLGISTAFAAVQVVFITTNRG